MIPPDTRPPLSRSEYRALRQLFGVVDAWDEEGSLLKKRLDLIPGGWRDAKMLMSVSGKLLRKILETVPREKLLMIKKELNSTTCEVSVRNTVAPVEKEAFTYVEEKAMERVTAKAMESECLFCEKRGREAKRCQLRKDIERLYMWDFPKIQNDAPCHFAQGRVEDFKNDTAL